MPRICAKLRSPGPPVAAGRAGGYDWEMGVGKFPRKPLPGSPQPLRAAKARPARRPAPPPPDIQSAEPPAEQPAEGPAVEVSGEDFKRLVRQTVFATSKDAATNAYHGVLVVAGGGRVKFVATDGRRLAVATAPATYVRSEMPVGFFAILPAPELEAYDQGVRQGRAVGFWGGPAGVRLSTGDDVVSFVPVVGTFPPYEDVIPAAPDKLFRAATADLLEGLGGVTVGYKNLPRVALALAPHGATAAGRDAEGRETHAAIPGAYTGAELVIGFNRDFLLDGLRAAETPDVELGFTAPNRPMRLRAGPDFLYVLMPVNLA